MALRLHPRFARLRKAGAPVRVTMPYGGDAWLVTGYEQTRFVLSDPRFSRAAAAGADVPRGRPGLEPAGNLLAMDPPEHHRIRALVGTAFTARRVELLQPRIQAIADTLLDGVAPPADFAAAVTWELPVLVICELLGVPAEQRRLVRECTETLVASDVTPEDVTRARGKLAGALQTLIAQRREQPADDLLTALVAARDEDDRLTDRELLMLGVALLTGGHETTANLAGSFLVELLSDRDRWTTLVARPELIPAAVEELLRYVPLSTVADFARIAREDLSLGGQIIRAGDAVLVQLDAANRDEEVFPSAAELDFSRAVNHHLAFGYGVHHCLGAPLARLELRILLSTLVRRLPGLRLAIPAEGIGWRRGGLLRGVTSLPVTW
ncbi:cytochrome P450 [Amycolatopsis sp. NPDC004169]|uniref:cytochrome P450 n=1 Tax=Amycolatopsis sp. NPDC004169 TaxID=3154453 RepID=UPI0033BE2318